MVPINYWAVLVAAVANMVIGSIWFGPMFSRTWMRLSGMTPEALERAKAKGMASQYLLAFVGSLLMAFVLAHAFEFASTYMKVSGYPAGISTGFWNWLGFIVPVTLGAVLWEGKSWKYWFLNIGYYLISLVVMGMIIAVM